MTGPVPIDQLERRLPPAGRIRIGRKGAGGKPDKLASFRFTSQDKASIEQVAALYGGTVTPWQGHAGQWEVLSPAKVLRVALAPDPLGNTPIYELWAEGGCLRRCTGRVAQVRVGSPDGGDVNEVDCICAQRGVLECKRVTRLSVILPEVRFLGAWRLDTGGDNASKELPGMVRLFEQLVATRGLQYAELRLEARQASVWSPKRGKFVRATVFVPTLGFDDSPDDLMAGPPLAALPPGPPTPPRGELVSEGPILGAEVVSTEEKPIPVVAYHPDPDLVQAWKDSLTTTQENKVLRLVREGWRGWEMPPQAFEEIPLEVIDLFMEKGIDAMERAIAEQTS